MYVCVCVCVCVCEWLCVRNNHRERKRQGIGVEEGKGRDNPCHDPQLSGEAAQDLVLFMQLSKAPRRSRQWNRRIHPNSTPPQVTKSHQKAFNDETTFCIWKDYFTLFVFQYRTEEVISDHHHIIQHFKTSIAATQTQAFACC